MKTPPRTLALSAGLLAAGFACLLGGPLTALSSCSAEPSGTEPTAAAADDQPEWEKNVAGEPGPATPDRFHPDFNVESDDMPAPRKGGKVIVHLSSKPKNLNYTIENSASTRRILRELSETLVARDWEYWDLRPVVAKTWVVEDALILKGGRGEGLHDNVYFGKVEEADGVYRVTPLSKDNPLGEAIEVPKDQVESVQRATVHTFEVRDGVKWHDGKTLDANDVLFSFYVNFNDELDNKQMRFKWEKFRGAELVDDMTVRFVYSEAYYLASYAFEDLTLMASHVFNLNDPENPDYEADWTPAADETLLGGIARSDRRQGVYINEHPNNTMWIGVGPYRVTEFTEQHIEAERFDDYFDPSQGGHVDKIRWSHIAADDAAKVAVLNGDLDYWDRLKSEDYFGAFTQQSTFADNYYKGYVVYPAFGYTVWNMRRDKFADPVVRQALGHCFDWDEYINTVANGLGSRQTGPDFYFGPTYDKSVEPISFDLDLAEEMLLEAGWYDRDGDDIIDKDGVPFEIEFLMPTGNKASEKLALILQENLGRVGIKMDVATREWAQFLESLYNREFDCANLAWILDVPESDPEQVYHGKWADAPRSSNHSGLNDPEVDRLIEAIQVELDDEKRYELSHQMHRRIYELQPVMFGIAQPKKFAMSKRVRNLRNYAPDPGYRIRDWFIVDEVDAKEASADGQGGKAAAANQR